MTWTEQVQINRIQVARATGTKPRKASLAPPSTPSPPNSGLAPIALVAALLGGALYWSKEGHKVRGRRLPPFLERLHSLLGGIAGRTPGARADRQHLATAVTAGPQQQQQQQEDDWRQQAPRALAAAAAEQRFQQQQRQEQAAPFSGGSNTGSGSNKNKKKKSNKKRR